MAGVVDQVVFNGFTKGVIEVCVYADHGIGFIGAQCLDVALFAE